MALPDEGATQAPINDDWGRDPQVRAMRRIFGRMETLQTSLLQKAGISPFDKRLGHWRRSALRSFEQEWTSGAGCERTLTEEDLSRMYIECLVRILLKDEVVIPG